MKKAIALILVFVLLLPSISHAKATEKRSLVEFLELYASRYGKYAAENDTKLLIEYTTYIPPYEPNDSDYLCITSTAGTIYVDTERYGYYVHRIDIPLFTLDDDTFDNDKIVNVAVAISALEFDNTYEITNSLSKKYLNTEKSAVKDAFKILDVITDKMSDAFTRSYKTGELAYVCSYNYNYYIRYWKYGDKGYVDLVAQDQ